MKRIILLVVFSASLMLIGAAMAVDIKEVTDTLMTPTAIITKLLVFACYVIGAILIFAAIAQYKMHRQSPKLVPLTTPILLVCIGIALILVPYFTTLPSETGSVVEQAKRTGADQPARSQFSHPTEAGNQTGPGSLPPDEPVEPYEPPPPKSGSGHWSDKYR